MCEHISGVCQLVCKPRTHTRKSFTSSTVSSPVVSSVISALLFGESRPGDDNALCISSNTPENGQRYDKENRVNAMNIPSNPDFWTSYCNTHTHHFEALHIMYQEICQSPSASSADLLSPGDWVLYVPLAWGSTGIHKLEGLHNGELPNRSMLVGSSAQQNYYYFFK